MSRDGARGLDLVRALECFVTTMNTGSMSEAGRKLGITQSAVSQQVATLEDALGAQLVDRRLRPLRPTSDGIQLFARAELLLEEASQILSSSRNLSERALPVLRLSVLSSLCRILGPTIAHSLHDQLSIGRIVVSSGLAHTHRQALLNREADVLITSDPLLDIDALERHEIMLEPFVLLLPAGTLFAGDLQSLGRKLPLVRYHAESPIGVKIQMHLRRQGIELPHLFEFDSADSVVATVAAGKAWAITSSLHVFQGVRDWHQVECIPLPKPGMSRLTVVVSRRGELKGLPWRIAQLAKTAVRDTVAPAIVSQIPFLRADVKANGVVHLRSPPT